MTSSSSISSPLGRLASVPLRESWPGEASDFTPWLAEEENLALLGSTIGLDLELIDTEKDVGPYRADIVCKDIAEDSWVLIENQLAKTDHTHLGQILTYAAGLSAVHIVWIAKRFTDEHRAALDWLNENTSEELRFFGLEVELWRIGDSPPAPKFNVVCQPNDWTKNASRRLAGGPEITPTKAIQQEFWKFFYEYCDGRPLAFKPRRGGPRPWMSMALGLSRFHLRAVISRKNTTDRNFDTWEIRSEFVMVDAADSFETMHALADEIHEELGFPLEWIWAENAKEAKAMIRNKGDLFDRNQWPTVASWLADHLDAMHRVFAQRIRSRV